MPTAAALHATASYEATTRQLPTYGKGVGTASHEEAKTALHCSAHGVGINGNLS